ncbi:MAG: UDP-N-acetylmuramoyl-tripeptide--D-alanyl-D-alanine ligase [Patescibacteria group bacterium]
MISPINLFIAFLWFLSAVVDYADFCYIWQLKEYRIDRFRDFLTTEQGKYFWIRYRLMWRSLIAIVIFFWPINDMVDVKYLLILLFIVDLAHALLKTFTKQMQRPVLTKKAIIIILASIFAEGMIFVILRDWTIFLLLLIVRFFILTAVVIVLQRLSNFIKNYYIRMAGKKLSFYPNLTIIGITGSYGKTSVKNFLTHILSGKYNTISAPKNINTDIGVAEFVLRTDFAKTNIFIVEMGAYKIGEIKKICDMVKPKIGILTAISEQHLSLFGDIKKTQQAKYELLLSLPADGLAVVNADNAYCRECLHEIKAPVMTFGIEPENNPTYLIENIKSGLNGTTWRRMVNGQETKVESPLIGEYTVMNVAPCALVALHLQMTIEQINAQIKTLPPNIKISESAGRTVIDDSYNSNPDGFRAALDILNKFSSEKKRIIITRGMLELGERSDEIHRQIAEDIEFVADELVVITKDFVEPLRSPLNEKYRTNFVLKDNPIELLKYVKELRDTNCVILLENRVPWTIRRELGLV